MFAIELDRRLRAARSRIMSVAAHPGVANTNLFRSGARSTLSAAVRGLLSQIIGAVLNTDGEGALPTIYAATSPNVSDGGYYGPQGLLETRGSTVGEAIIATRAKDAATAARLWQVCEELTRMRFRPS
jgi:hypothetical protein